MGLTASSSGLGLLQNKAPAKEQEQLVVALAGNPNVGKSTVFNALTNMHQHTGNWPGKTVVSAQGTYTYDDKTYSLVDLPGCYSLMAHSPEEEVARDFICFGNPDVTVIVCDATCLERNLNLVLQTLEITHRAVVCVNLMDEAKKKHIKIDLLRLEELLGIPVVGCSARSGEGLAALLEKVKAVSQEQACTGCEGCLGRCMKTNSKREIRYPAPVEEAIQKVQRILQRTVREKAFTRWLALRLLEGEEGIYKAVLEHRNIDLKTQEDVLNMVGSCKELLQNRGIEQSVLKDQVVSTIYQAAENIARQVVTECEQGYQQRQLKIDRILTGKYTAIPIMMMLVCLVFYLTITGANYPSQLLSKGLFWLEEQLSIVLKMIGVPYWLHDALVLGVYRVLAWVVSVMLPPMAIFFPLFTILEDLGYLPRAAFVLDKQFKRCGACGKQALTTCMGFGCNAAGVVGCRIIDSPRERLIAILTNSFVPCNGRFPMLIAIITMFYAGSTWGIVSLLASLELLVLVIAAVSMTFVVSKFLSKTVLKGIPSSFTLELPPYRRPQITKVILRSVFDRTIFVLGRAAAVAAPAGLVIWILANAMIDGTSLLSHFAKYLDPFARLIGLDGVILTAFILGFPANEIVLPIALMAYSSSGSLSQSGPLDSVYAVLQQNGWTWLTALCTLLFSLFHWPCSTTLLTIHKETGSVKWTLLAVILPTFIGMGLCFTITSISRLFGMS